MFGKVGSQDADKMRDKFVVLQEYLSVGSQYLLISRGGEGIIGMAFVCQSVRPKHFIVIAISPETLKKIFIKLWSNIHLIETMRPMTQLCRLKVKVTV